MKYSVFILIILAFLSCRRVSETVVRLQVEGELPEIAPALITKDSTYHADWGADNSVEFVLPKEAKHSYAIFFLGKNNVLGFIEPGKNFEVSVKLENGEAQPTFSGEGAEVCRFLNSGIARFTPDYKLGEDEFFSSLKKQVQKMHAEVDARGFSREFSTLEKNRMAYNVYCSLVEYPSSHTLATWTKFTPTETYYNKLTSVFTEDETLLDMQSYQQFLKKYLAIMIYKDSGELNDDYRYLNTELECITGHFKNPKVVEYLVQEAVMRYVASNGIGNLPEFLPVYRKAVNDEAKKAAFDELCDKWRRIVKGQPSPSFTYSDIHGKKVSLEDFAGKYVYIDNWASWCGPCRAEIPALKKLEEKYKGKNICFVGISCDQDREAWEKALKEENLEGIQLHAKGYDNFSEVFMITAIPRFILLDPQGKIVNAYMTRPSDPETEKFLSTLQGL